MLFLTLRQVCAASNWSYPLPAITYLFSFLQDEVDIFGGYHVTSQYFILINSLFFIRNSPTICVT